MDKAVIWLKERLEYEFDDQRLLLQALTHRSSSGLNNERLEYLGDAVLDVVVSEVTYWQQPEASEGVLSRLRSSLVKDATLAEIATSLRLGEHLLLGPGEKKTGGHRRASILADALEAIFGAVYLDAGFAAARQVIHKAYGDRLQNVPASAARRDPKTRLQEYLQARKIALPSYTVKKITGKAHRQSFEVSCSIGVVDASTTGQGTSRRDAEQDAAAKMLSLLEQTL